ncbi:MAG: ferrous iron transport protein A [Desulfocapsa sp.]|uniref:Ferrous iron transport protein A n=1 Tax=Desulfotalea psychrophila TaxID=84980 RepID=A0ABS3B075_9BACT|nr:ferrous iron transport protein A [Desulfocapsa sp.]MBN4068980.1 ferrous iron transport protein A [Desulfotalea psychrophila]
MGHTLSDFGVGMTGKIVGFGKGNKEYRRKLLAMGLIKGTEFTVKRVAPMGDPVEITVRGYSLTLRKDEAAVIAVEGV